MRCAVPASANDADHLMVSGIRVVQQRLELVARADLPHFDLIPSLDRVELPSANFFVAEAEIAPSNALPACGCGVQKNSAIWGVLRDQMDVLRGDARATCRAIRDIGCVDYSQS